MGVALVDRFSGVEKEIKQALVKFVAGITGLKLAVCF